LDAIVTLTTDFGVRDPYVAEMKGAILGIVRTAGRAVQLVDLTHEVARHDVVEGALALETAAPFFPGGTVHVAVIDPGVGTARRGIAVAARGQVFVGPDNGVFTPFLSGTGWRAFELAAPEYRLPAVSRTFHGRDVFAPAAAHVATGVDVARLGPVVSDPVRLEWAGARARGGAPRRSDDALRDGRAAVDSERRRDPRRARRASGRHAVRARAARGVRAPRALPKGRLPSRRAARRRRRRHDDRRAPRRGRPRAAPA